MIRLDIQNFCKECANREICKWFSKVSEDDPHFKLVMKVMKCNRFQPS